MNDKIRDIRDKLNHDELFVCVTRCKDCKHFIKSINKGCCRRVGYFQPNDYCSYGERRESDAD